MSDDDYDDPIEYSDEVKRDMAADPELAAAVREFSAAMRQAVEGVKRGQYASVLDGIEAITGQRPEPIE